MLLGRIGSAKGDGVVGPLRSNIPALLLSSALGSLACDSVDAKRGAEAPRTMRAAEQHGVRLVPVTVSAFEETIEMGGTLAAEEQVTLATKVSGRLSTIDIDLASPVRQGELIAQVETTDYDFGVRQALALLGQARARLSRHGAGARTDASAIVRQAKSTLDEARLNEARLTRLAKEGLTPQAGLDAARATSLRAEASLELAREEVQLRKELVRQRESELAIARQRLADTAIRSPLDGFVQARRASRGEYLPAGAPVAELVSIHRLRLRLTVPEREAARVRAGQVVRVSAESSGQPREHSGTVARIAPSLDAHSRSLLIEADIDSPGTLRPGNFVHARISIGQRRVATLPESAIVTFAGQEKVILVAEGHAVERTVAAGERRGGLVEVVLGHERANWSSMRPAPCSTDSLSGCSM
jgi:HlyD family secretion protein